MSLVEALRRELCEASAEATVIACDRATAHATVEERNQRRRRLQERVWYLEVWLERELEGRI